MNTVLLYAARSFLSLMVALLCSAEARSGSFGQDPEPVVVPAPQLPARSPVIPYRIENLRAPRR